MTQSLQTGDAAPAFDMPSNDGRAKLSDYAGKTLVLYFYPKDDTPGCTKQAIGFTEHLSAFAAAGAEVLGVSKDTLAKHEKFIDKHDLKIRLATDDDGAVCDAFGVWIEKKMYGKTYMGIERATFLIGPDGVIREIWRKVKVPGHVEKVLDAAQLTNS
ncbi:MAG: thioredoxin-dependent thiol peroxidase [Pseudomonadota bacterium]